MSSFNPVVKIVNVVVSATLPHKLDLAAITKGFPSLTYRRGRFPGVIFRLKKPKTGTLLFGSGKMICAGARSEKEAEKAVKKVVKALKEGGILMTGKPEIVVRNIVATGSLGGAIDLVEFCESERHSGGRVMYEPEQFPGLIYRMNEPRTVILVFASGKIVCTGVRNEKDVYVAVNKLLLELEGKNLIYRQ